MSGNKFVKRANKKALKERKRREKRDQLSRSRQTARVRKGRMHKMMAQGRKEHKALRRAEGNYINQLEQEINEQ